MARFVFVFLLLVGFSLGDILTSKSASAGVVAKIDLSEQRMRVYVNGRIAHTWQISSGRGRFRTPTGNYNPYRMHRMWYSQRYNNAPMPFSVFYHRGYAIHGTDQISRLGQVASHGCIRLHPNNAHVFYDLVRRHGASSTQIQIVN